MKKMWKIYAALLVLLPVAVFATITADQEFQLNRLNGVAYKARLGTLINKTPNVVVGKYSYAVQGGTANSSVYLLSDLLDTNSRITIPDNAVVKQVYVDTLTAPLGSSVSVSLVGTADLMAVKGTGAMSGVLAGVPINTAATMIKLSADKRPYMDIYAGGLSAGKINVYIEYVLGD